MLDQARQSRLVRRWASSSFAVPALAQAAQLLKNDCNRMHDDTESYMNKASAIHPRTESGTGGRPCPARSRTLDRAQEQLQARHCLLVVLVMPER